MEAVQNAKKPDEKPAKPKAAKKPGKYDNQTPAQKFQRLANARVNKALKAISQIAHLGNRSQYESTEEQRSRIVQHLSMAVGRVHDAFEKASPVKQEFSV